MGLKEEASPCWPTGEKCLPKGSEPFKLYKVSIPKLFIVFSLHGRYMILYLTFLLPSELVRPYIQ